MSDLVARHLLIEGEKVRGKRGQPGVSLQLNPDGAYSAGCQIGFGQCYFFIRSLGGKVLYEEEFAIDRCAFSRVAATLATIFEHAMGQQDPNIAERFVGVGVAVPADFDRLSQVVMGTHAEGWDERAFRVELERSIGVPVTTYATGVAGAWAELAATPPPRPADYLYLFVDRFVQSGMLLDGRLWMAPQARHGGLGRMLVRQGAGVERLYNLVGGQNDLK